MMFARTIRPLRYQLHHVGRFSRNYNGQNKPVEAAKTYFQNPPPPPPKPRRRVVGAVLLGSTCFVLGSYVHTVVSSSKDIATLIATVDAGAETAWRSIILAGNADRDAKFVPPMSLEDAQSRIEMAAHFATPPGAVSHGCQLGSNMPCEDVMVSAMSSLYKDPSKNWSSWSIYDGHAGPRTARVLAETLPAVVAGELFSTQCMDRPYTPNDTTIVRAIKEAFQKVDRSIMQYAADHIAGGESDLAFTIAVAAPALSGSCALLALFDPTQSVLRVANTGDSRAVLGRWDSNAGKYVAMAMSVDQTGFNEHEAARIRREHPGEDPIDPKTGRVHGIAVTRAFGDARWKWPNELSQTVHEKFWGPAPRPEGLIKTPPYLTAEPEIVETKIRTGDHPDFLIMASDGLWDHMSSEHAVTCVQRWMDTYKPIDLVNAPPSTHDLPPLTGPSKYNEMASTSVLKVEEDTYWDETERAMKWRVSPEHFIVEDTNCSLHLIKNALGGKRRNLFRGIMTIQPPYSRNVRDDISVHVIFFGVDVESAKNSRAKNT